VKLKVINFRNCVGITNRGMEKLKFASELESLNIESCQKISDVGLEYLRENRKLKRLNTKGTQVSSEGFQKLKMATNL